MTTTWTTVHWIGGGSRQTAAHPARHRPYRARGRVFKTGNTWRYEVVVGGKVVNADDTGQWRSVFDGCREAVFAFDHVLGTGHKIKKTWDEIVDGAS